MGVEGEPGDDRRGLRQHERALLARSPVPARATELHRPLPAALGVREVGLVGQHDQVVVGDDRVGEGACVVDRSDDVVGVGLELVEPERDPPVEPGPRGEPWIAVATEARAALDPERELEQLGVVAVVEDPRRRGYWK